MRGMTSQLSRRIGQQTEEKADIEPEPDAEGSGLRVWLHAMPKATTGRSAAGFDTRLDSRMAGGAAPGIARRLRGHGYPLAAEPEGGSSSRTPRAGCGSVNATGRRRGAQHCADVRPCQPVETGWARWFSQRLTESGRSRTARGGDCRGSADDGDGAVCVSEHGLADRAEQ
jgi:hypothetical protein